MWEQQNIFEEGTTLGTVEDENVNALGETVYNCLGFAENEIFAWYIIYIDSILWWLLSFHPWETDIDLGSAVSSMILDVLDA